MSSGPSTVRRLAFIAWLGGWLVLAALIWAWALPQQIARGCWIREWPFEDGCSAYPSRDSDSNSIQVYLDHLQRNIGDAHTWARLTKVLWLAKDPRAEAVLPFARQFAPYNPHVLVVEAESALGAKDWPRLAKALVALVERGHAVARQPLAALMISPEGQEAVLATLNPDSRWLDGMLASLDPKIPVARVQPFVSQGSQLGILNPDTVLAMVERMQRDGNWLDAYTLWVSLRGKVPEGLFNSGFDQRATQRAFDWQWPAETSGARGLRISQVSAAPQDGLMMEVEMTGRSALPQPMMMQPILLFARKYTFSGRYMSDRMRTDEGLVWALRCAAGGERFAQTAAMKDTARKWESFKIEVQVPAECGNAVRMQLETAAPWEAKAGVAGVIYFDDFVLKPVKPGGA
ncbi:MAG: hypothetical protein ABI434_21505 [Burkholderiaceae bacterium]